MGLKMKYGKNNRIRRGYLKEKLLQPFSFGSFIFVVAIIIFGLHFESDFGEPAILKMKTSGRKNNGDGEEIGGGQR